MKPVRPVDRCCAGSPLVVAELAVALVLVVAAGLLMRSFENMRSVGLGFRTDHTITA